MSVIKCTNLSKNYDDVEALKKINLEVTDGEFFGLLGPNGAGKNYPSKDPYLPTKAIKG